MKTADEGELHSSQEGWASDLKGPKKFARRADLSIMGAE